MVLIVYWWLTMILVPVVVIVEGYVEVVVQGGGGLEDCPETRCNDQNGPVIRFPFRIQGRQPKHCGLPGFDISCFSHKNDTILMMPSSPANFFVYDINYTSQGIAGRFEGSWPAEIFYKNQGSSSSPFTFVGYSASLFSCPPSILRDKFFNASHYPSAHFPSGWEMLRHLHAPGQGNHIYAVLEDFYYIDQLPVLFCTKMHDYTSELKPQDIFSNTYDSNFYQPAMLHWSIKSCQHCEEMLKTCRLIINNFTHQTHQIQCLDHKGQKNGIFITSGRGKTCLKILGICGLCLVVIATGMAMYYIYSSNKTEKEIRLRIKTFLDEYKALKPSRYSYADIKRITNQFEEKLGQGAYGTVYKGKLSSELLVAVKVLNNSNENGEDFINEVGTLCQIHHVNVVRLVGFCADGFIRALVYEFFPKGPLQNFLSSADDKDFLGWEKLQDIALGIAKGIEYLHQGCDQRILHFDIKPHNVLLDEDFTPKVSDFGLAKFCAKDQSAISMTTVRGTMGYIAPEVFSRNFGNVSYKSDVYSFGILLLEMVAGKKNKVMEDNPPTSQFYFPEWIYNLLEQGNDLRIHIGDQRILHFDIKPHNVLLDEDFTPKVSDFGLAKFCAKDQSAISMTTVRGTMGYIAPEVFSRNFGNVSYKSDVYSFGILLLEMVAGKKNKVMEDNPPTSQFYFPEWIYNLLEQGNDLRIHIGDQRDVGIARKLAIVGLWCIQWHPIDRPSMKAVVQMLEREGDDNLTMPPNPFASASN